MGNLIDPSWIVFKMEAIWEDIFKHLRRSSAFEDPFFEKYPDYKLITGCPPTYPQWLALICGGTWRQVFIFPAAISLRKLGITKFSTRSSICVIHEYGWSPCQRQNLVVGQKSEPTGGGPLAAARSELYGHCCILMCYVVFPTQGISGTLPAQGIPLCI